MAKIYPSVPKPKIPPLTTPLISDIATGGIFGLGTEGYILAIISIQKIIENENR